MTRLVRLLSVAGLVVATKLGHGGSVVRVEVEIACATGLDVLEAFLTVSQAGVQTNFVGMPVVCDDNEHNLRVRAAVPEGQSFSKGEAHVSAFVLLLDATTGTTISLSPVQRVHIGPRGKD